MKLEQMKIKRMGTTITVSVFHEKAAVLLEQAKELIIDFENRFSANDPSSDLMHVNKHAGIKPISVDGDLFDLIRIGRNVSISSGGVFNIAIGPIVKIWRIGFEDARVPSQEEIQQRLSIVDPEKIELDEEAKSVFLREKGMEIDLGAIAKGYFADRLKDFFLKQDVQSGIINLGGNVLTIGSSPNQPDGYWRIGIQDPFKSRGQILAALPVKNQSVVTSGVYERILSIDGKEYHHIFDSKNGYPIENDLASVTVVSDQSIDGEIWTGLLFAQRVEEGMDRLNRTEGIEGIIVAKDGTMHISERLKDKVERIR